MRRVAPAAWLLVMFLELCAAAVPVHAAEGEARVLILNGTDPYLPAYLEIDRAMRASLSQEAVRRIVYFSEPLDAQRFQVEAYEPELTALLARKYSGLRIDVVVAVSQRALDFFGRHGALLWPGARLVFSGWPGEVFESTSGLPPDAAAVVADVSARETIDLARGMQPNARRMVVISGASDLDKRNERQVRQVLASGTDQLPFEFITGLPLPELASRVAAEPADTIVFYIAQFRDREGRPYTPREVLRAISTQSVAPVYGMVETYLGFGMAAGVAESYEDHGKPGWAGHQRGPCGQLIRTKAESGQGGEPGASPMPARCSAGRWTSGVCRRAVKSDLPITRTGANICGRSLRRWQSSSGRAC